MRKLINFLVLNLFVFIFTFITRPTMAVTLPAGYTELEYIESTGTQYIDTRFVPTSDYKHTLVFSTTDDGTGYIAGTGTDGGRGGNVKLTLGKLENVYVGSAEAAAIALVNNPSSYTVTSKTTLVMDLHNNAVSNVFLSGQNISSGNVATIVSTNSLYLFGSGSASPLNSKIYQDIIEQNGVLVRNFVPAKNSSGVIGMYDTVNNRFYTNAGSGSFVAGPIACDGQIVTYTSATGTVVQNGTPTPTNPVEPVFYQQGNIVLRKVGDYADSYDASTGKITRRIGVKVFNGSESCRRFSDSLNVIVCDRIIDSNGSSIGLSNAFSRDHTGTSSLLPGEFFPGNTNSKQNIYFNYGEWTDTKLAEFKQYLTDQYNAGTPVVVYYQLAEAVEETVPTSYCQQRIRVATTKYVETQFSDLNSRLAAAVATVNTVVSNTITQAASIATLQSGKQTRPADDPTDANNTENCPAGKKCLLVEDASGKPHWYEIFDPINRWMEAFFKTNPNGQYVENGVDFRRWQGNPAFRKTYIDGSTSVYVRQWTAASPARTVGGMYQTLPAGDLENAGSWAVEWDGTEDDIDAGAVYGIAKCTSVAGTLANKLTSAQESAFCELPAPVGQEERTGYERANFKQCWCKMTAVGVPGEDGDPANGSVYPVNPSSSAWVFYYTYGSAANCASDCAYRCADNVRGLASFRSAVFGLQD